MESEAGAVVGPNEEVFNDVAGGGGGGIRISESGSSGVEAMAKEGVYVYELALLRRSASRNLFGGSGRCESCTCNE
jgi:hypothetical protein